MDVHTFSRSLVAVAVAALLSGCGAEEEDGGGNVAIDIENQPPTAEASNWQTVDMLTEVTITGSGEDTDGTIVKAEWNQVAGPSITLTSSDTNQISFTAPEVNDGDVEIISFEYTVTDDDGATDSDIADVEVVYKADPVAKVQPKVQSLRVAVSAFADYDLSEDFRLNTALSERVMFSDLGFIITIQTPDYQILFLTKADDQSLIAPSLMDTESSKWRGGDHDITVDSIALGTVAMLPMMMGYSRADRALILDEVKKLPLFEDFKKTIEHGIATDFKNLMNYDVFPEVYHSAFAAFEAASSALGSTQWYPLVADSTGFIQPTNQHQFVASNYSGAYYDINTQHDNVALAYPRAVGWELFGDLSTLVTERVFSTDDFQQLSLTKNAPATLIHGLCRVLDAINWCPLTSAAIGQLTAEQLKPFLHNAIQQTSGNSPHRLYAEFLNWMRDEQNWRNFSSLMFEGLSVIDQGGDIDGNVSQIHLQAAKSFFDNAAKALRTYDAYTAEQAHPVFARDFLLGTEQLSWCFEQVETDGYTHFEMTCDKTPPVGVITHDKELDEINIGDSITFSAEKSFGSNEQPSAYEVRWDFNNDNSFDTQWSFNHTATTSYTEPGEYEVIMEIRAGTSDVDRTMARVVVK